MRWAITLAVLGWIFFQLATFTFQEENYVNYPVLIMDEVNESKDRLHNVCKTIPDGLVAAGGVSVPALFFNHYYLEDSKGNKLFVKALRGQSIPQKGEMVFITGQFKSIYSSEDIRMTVFVEQSRKVFPATDKGGQ